MRVNWDFLFFFISVTFLNYTKNCTLPRNILKICLEVQKGMFSSLVLSNGDGSSALWELYLYFCYMGTIQFINFVQVGARSPRSMFSLTHCPLAHFCSPLCPRTRVAVRYSEKHISCGVTEREIAHF